MAVTHKTEVTTVDATPVKRTFWSIIADYDLRTGVCELIDNAIDLWTLQGRRKPLTITVHLDVDRQLISVQDNAGGVKEHELRLLVALGGSRNPPSAELIGIFGVGGKRAGVALGELVEIKTRFHKQSTFQIDLTREWLETDDDWQLPTYRIPDIEPGTTHVDISRVRRSFSQEDVDDLAVHLGDTYSWFLDRDCAITVNTRKVRPRHFDHWAYPPGFLPQHAHFDADLGKEGALTVDITAGLILDRDPEEENYGVYIYCNHRLIAKALKTREVGYFVSTEAGVPHPDASLCRAIVLLQGGAKLMPFTSSKSGINVGHPAFQQLRPTLIRLVSHFSSLSRRLKNEWDKKVFSYKKGQIEAVNSDDAKAGRNLNLPPLPRVYKHHVEQLRMQNKRQLQDKPWTLGLVEAIAAVEIITNKRLQTKNRIALILLDSNFEIALKEYIVHHSDLFPPKQFNDATIQQLFQRRPDVIDAVAQHVPIPTKLLDKARHYYGLRNKLIHERATVDVTDSDIDNYRGTIQQILTILFGLKFSRR